MIKSFSETKRPENGILGVEFKELKTYPDERGFFRELIRHNDSFFTDGSSPNGFAQWSHSKMGKNTVKAWHFHHVQVDWWYCPIGLIHTVLFDIREESPTFRRKIEFKLGDEALDSAVLTTIVKIPPGVIHGCKVLVDNSHLFYVTSMTYNTDDEGRYPFNSDVVPHSWGNEKDFTISANDRKVFIPKSPRKPL